MEKHMVTFAKPKPTRSDRYAQAETLFRDLMKQLSDEELEHACQAVGENPIGNVMMQPHTFAAMAAFAMVHEIHLREMEAE